MTPELSVDQSRFVIKGGMTLITQDGLTIPDGEAKLYAVYRNPGTSEVAEEHRTLCGALAQAAPSQDAEIMQNGRTMAISVSLDAFEWVLTAFGRSALLDEHELLLQRWRK